MRIASAAALLAGLVSLLPSARLHADPIHGRWRVRSYTSTTLTLDGAEKLKGPFTEKPSAMSVRVTAKSYVSNDAGKVITYAIRRAAGGYVLSRRGDDGPVTITLSGVTVRGKQLRFTSTRINRPRQERYVVRWVCERAAAAQTAPTSLVGTGWRLLEIAYNDDRVVKPERDDPMTIEFAAGGRVAGQAGPNRFQGSCRASGPGPISIGPLATTRIAVPPGSIADTYVRELQAARSYLINKGQLVLVLPVDAGILRFARVTD